MFFFVYITRQMAKTHWFNLHKVLHFIILSKIFICEICKTTRNYIY